MIAAARTDISLWDGIRYHKSCYAPFANVSQPNIIASRFDIDELLVRDRNDKSKCRRQVESRKGYRRPGTGDLQISLLPAKFGYRLLGRLAAKVTTTNEKSLTSARVVGSTGTKWFVLWILSVCK